MQQTVQGIFFDSDKVLGNILHIACDFETSECSGKQSRKSRAASLLHVTLSLSLMKQKIPVEGLLGCYFPYILSPSSFLLEPPD